MAEMSLDYSLTNKAETFFQSKGKDTSAAMVLRGTLSAKELLFVGPPAYYA